MFLAKLHLIKQHAIFKKAEILQNIPPLQVITHGAQSNIFWVNYVNTMATDALAPQHRQAISKPWWDKQILALHEEGFKLPTLSQFWEMIENANICFYVC